MDEGEEADGVVVEALGERAEVLSLLKHRSMRLRSMDWRPGDRQLACPGRRFDSCRAARGHIAVDLSPDEKKSRCWRC
jgi:hypothetical protein